MNKTPKIDSKTLSLFVTLIGITVIFVLGARLVLNATKFRPKPAESFSAAGFSDEPRANLQAKPRLPADAN